MVKFTKLSIVKCLLLGISVVLQVSTHHLIAQDCCASLSPSGGGTSSPTSCGSPVQRITFTWNPFPIPSLTWFCSGGPACNSTRTDPVYKCDSGGDGTCSAGGGSDVYATPIFGTCTLMSPTPGSPPSYCSCITVTGPAIPTGAKHDTCVKSATF